MFKRIKQILTVCGLAVAAIMAPLLAAPASAIAGPQSTITLDAVFSGDPPPTFTTTGDVLCPAGTASIVPDSFRATGEFGDHTQTFHLEYMLTCEDGSGTFTIRVQAKSISCAPTDSGGWAVVGGTGAYEDLHGGGYLVGTKDDPCAPLGIIDVYTGVVTN